MNKNITHPGTIILGGFAAMIIFMCYLVYQSVQNPPIMTSENYYEEELKYQEVINAKANASRFKDSIKMNKKFEEISFYIPQSLNNELTNLSVIFYHPSNDKEDQKFKFEKNEQGIYVVNTANMIQHECKIKLSFHSGDKDYYQEFNN